MTRMNGKVFISKIFGVHLFLVGKSSDICNEWKNEKRQDEIASYEKLHLRINKKIKEDFLSSILKIKCRGKKLANNEN